MPQVGENLATGVVLEWCKAKGDPVARGDVLAVVESEKAAFEVVAEEDGVLLGVACAAGAEAEVLQPIAWIGQPGETVPEGGGPTRLVASEAPAGDRSAAEAPSARSRPRPLDATSAGGTAPAMPPVRPRPSRAPSVASGRAAAAAAPAAHRPFASPSARRLARQLLVDLSGVRGSGPAGRVVRRDVLAAALDACGAAPAPLAIAPVVEGGDRVEPFARRRRAVAERMAASARHIPHVYLFADVDVTAAQALRRTLGGEPAVSLTDLVVAAVAAALRAHDRLNAHVGDGALVLKAGCHIGLAVAVDDGILVPALADADRRGLRDLARARAALTQAARRGVVAPSPAPTFTITNLGAYGVSRFLPLINPPECAILAVGKSGDRVVARDGAPAVRELLTLCLACDHRAVDGAYAGAFLSDLQARLEDPAALAASAP